MDDESSEIIEFKNLRTNETIYTNDVNYIKYNSSYVMSSMEEVVSKFRNELLNKYEGKLIKNIEEVRIGDEVLDIGVFSRNDFFDEIMDLKLNVINHIFNSSKDETKTRGSWAGDPIKITKLQSDKYVPSDFGIKVYEESLENHTLFPQKNDSDYIMVNLENCTFYDPRIEVLDINNELITYDDSGKVIKRLKSGAMLHNKTALLMMDFISGQNKNKEDMKLLSVDMKDHGYSQRMNALKNEKMIKKHCIDKNIDLIDVTSLLHLSIKSTK